MARSQDMQDALDLVAGRKQHVEKEHWGPLERFGIFLWIGVGLMVIGLAALYALGWPLG
jgi:hypothetical protein